MSNMSYCRFQNTAADVTDCINALNNHDIQSTQERHSAKCMLVEILKFCEQEGIIDAFDYKQVRYVCGLEEEG